MKRNLLVTAVISIMSVVITNAQEISFDDLYNNLSTIKAVFSESSSIPAPQPVQIEASNPTAPAPVEYEWLIMVFINGRNDLWFQAVNDVNEMEKIGSTKKVAVTVELGLLQDRGNSLRFLVQKDDVYLEERMPAEKKGVAYLVQEGDKSYLERLFVVQGATKTRVTNFNDIFRTMTSPATIIRNSDMGSYRHLVNFARWSIKNHPAKKHLLIVWNHGSGRIDIGGADNTGAELGIAYDDLTKNFIRNSQLGMALREISGLAGKKIDIFASDACLMQMASVAYELKDSVQFIIGSEELVPGAGFPYDTILQELNNSPSASPEHLASIIVEKFNAFYEANKNTILRRNKGTTISTLKSSEFSNFINALNSWVKSVATKTNRKHVLEAINKTLSFEHGFNGNDTTYNARSKDLYDFINELNKLLDNKSETFRKGEDLKKVIDGKFVIHNKITGPNNVYSRAKGIAVYFPKMIYDSSYDEMLFARDSLWDDFLKWTLDENYKVK